jgi:hypothetical protein
MSRIIKLTENDLARIVRRVINEQEEGVENFDSLINKTVNFYKTKDERQQDYAFQGTIKKITTPMANSISVDVEPDNAYPITTLTYKCTDTSGAFTGMKQPYFNKNLYLRFRSEFCNTSRRDKRNNNRSVPKADFASTGGNMGNVS